MRLNLAAPHSARLWALVAVAVFAWSFGPICVRFAFQYNMPPELVSFGRMLTASMLFTAVIALRGDGEVRSMSGQRRWLSLAAGALSGLNIVLMVASLQHISVIINQSLVATIPVWVALLEMFVLKVRHSRAVWLGILASLLGGVLMALATASAPAISSGGDPTLGVVLALLSSLSGSVYVIIGRKVRGNVGFSSYSWHVYGAGAVVTLLILAFNRVPLLGYDLQAYLWVLLLALLSQIIGHGTLNYVVKYISATSLTMTAQAIPVLGALWAFLLFSEVPTLLQAIGSGILLLGITAVLRAGA